MAVIYYVKSVADNGSKIDPMNDYSKSHVRFEVWRPSIIRVKPKGLPLYPFIVWWVFHHLSIFSNKNYHIYLAYTDENRLVHRSCVFPKYFRFPFMAEQDLQVGDTYTEDDFRGRGLAKFVLQNALADQSSSVNRLWYVVEDDNLPSIRVVEKSGFIRYGVGERRRSILGSLFGKYIINQYEESSGLQ